MIIGPSSASERTQPTGRSTTARLGAPPGRRARPHPWPAVRFGIPRRPVGCRPPTSNDRPSATDRDSPTDETARRIDVAGERVRRHEAGPPWRPGAGDTRDGSRPRGRPVRSLLAELHRLVRTQPGALRRVHRDAGGHPRAGLLARPGGHRGRGGPRRPARGLPCDMGPQDGHGPAALGPASLRPYDRRAGGRAVAELGGLGRPGRALRGRGGTAPVPRSLCRRAS